jgi:hypothetical protein
MSNISQVGSYRGLVVDRGLSNSSGGHLQFELTLQATEKYDEANQVWTLFDFEDSEAQAYMNLITSKEQENAINCRQIMRAFGWDGVSYLALNNPDSSLAKQIQWRMGMETYNNVERCKVQAIDAYDTTPGRKVEKLDAAAVRALDAKYAGILKKLSGGPKPKTARPTPPVATPPAAVPTPDPTPMPTTPIPTPVGTLVTPAPVSEPAKPKRGRPAAPKAPPITATPVATGEPLDQSAAWEVVTTRSEKAGKTDLEVANAWTCVVKELGGDEKVGEDWSGVAAEICKRLEV